MYNAAVPCDDGPGKDGGTDGPPSVCDQSPGGDVGCSITVCNEVTNEPVAVKDMFTEPFWPS